MRLLIKLAFGSHPIPKVIQLKQHKISVNNSAIFPVVAVKFNVSLTVHKLPASNKQCMTHEFHSEWFTIPQHRGDNLFRGGAQKLCAANKSFYLKVRFYLFKKHRVGKCFDVSLFSRSFVMNENCLKQKPCSARYINFEILCLWIFMVKNLCYHAVRHCVAI